MRTERELKADIVFLLEMEDTLNAINTDDMHAKSKLATMIGDWKSGLDKKLKTITSPCCCKLPFKRKNYDECSSCGGRWTGRQK